LPRADHCFNLKDHTVRRILLSVSALAFTLALAACGSSEEPAAEQSATATPTPAPLPTEIPADYQGRWGMTGEDCTGDAAAAKGLLEISPTEMKFYESVGTLEEVTEATSGRVRAKFAFTGEGMSWERDVVLDLREGGKILVRREFGEDASPEPFDYTRCS
jgi:hypothetical protein